MKSSLFSPLALAAVVLQAATAPFAGAFVPSTPSFSPSNSRGHVAGEVAIAIDGDGSSSSSLSLSWALHMASSGGSFLGANEYDDEDEDDEDEDDDEDDDDDYALSSSDRYDGVRSPFTGVKLDPYDPNPLIKPRPSRYFRDDDSTPKIPDDELVQNMSADERKENLSVMRQIRKSDLPDLRMRKDYAGWVEANNDLKKRYAKDPWFKVNERLRKACQLGETDEKIDQLKKLAIRLGGPPAGIDIDHNDKRKPYAVHTEIYDIGLSSSRISSMLEREVREERAARGRAMMAERRKNMEAEQRQYEEDMRNPGLREDREAKERRERTMRRLLAEIEEDNKKKQERVKEILGKLPETPTSRTESLKKALKGAQEDVKKMRREQLGKAEGYGLPAGAAGDDTEEKSSADRAREAAAAESSGGRPRLPGDTDVTRGELSITVESSSSTRTGPLQVDVSSVYNKDQSDPPMRKHCFQYTIRIKNHSSTDTIQLLGRRFEIQTVGSSMKDVVQGEGVTGRTPILKPGEVFEYTSTAPLSVRPIGTTIIAARMKGEYRYTILAAGQETASPEQIQSGGESTAELGTFHFIFPEDQRVKPFRSETSTDDDEEEEEDDDEDSAPVAKAPASAPAPSSAPPAAAPASTLPGDADMTSGDLKVPLTDKSDEVTDQVRVQVTSSYRPERSDAALDKHCFAYNIRITNERTNEAIQLVSRRFEIQTVGSPHKDVVQGPGVTGRQPILQPGESFEYTSTAPLSVKPLLDKTPAVARMQGEYNFVVLSDDGTTPLSSTPLQAKLGMFHFVLPAMV